MRDLKLTLLQADLHWEDPAANRAMFSELIRSAAPDADLIVLPEMFSTGFTMQAAANAEGMDGPTVSWMQELAADSSTALCGGLVIHEQGHYFNRFVFTGPDGAVHTYDKRHLFRMVGEREQYSCGRQRQIIQLGDWRICPMVCYDLRFPVWSRSRNDYDLLLYVANWPTSRRSAWDTLLPARAVENLCYAAGVNRTGTDGNDAPYFGGSLVADYLGKTLASAGAEPATLQVTLSGSKLLAYRKKFLAWKDADRFELNPEPAPE